MREDELIETLREHNLESWHIKRAHTDAVMDEDTMAGWANR